MIKLHSWDKEIRITITFNLKELKRILELARGGYVRTGSPVSGLSKEDASLLNSLDTVISDFEEEEEESRA